MRQHSSGRLDMETSAFPPWITEVKGQFTSYELALLSYLLVTQTSLLFLITWLVKPKRTKPCSLSTETNNRSCTLVRRARVCEMGLTNFLSFRAHNVVSS